MFLIVKEELKRFTRYYIKIIDIPRIGIELDYTETNKIQQKRIYIKSMIIFINNKITKSGDISVK